MSGSTVNLKPRVYKEDDYWVAELDYISWVERTDYLTWESAHQAALYRGLCAGVWK